MTFSVRAGSSVDELIAQSKKLYEDVKSGDYQLPKKELYKLSADAEFFFYQKDYYQSLVRLKMAELEHKKAKVPLPRSFYILSAQVQMT